MASLLEQQVRNLIPWPYAIRRSSRAKSLRISVSREHGVEVVYPRWSSRKVALQFLLESRCWLSQHKEILQQALSFRDLPIPDFIDFKLLNKYWNIMIEFVPKQKIVLYHRPGGVLLHGHVTDLVSVGPVFRELLLSLAEEHLTPKVRQISTEIGLPFNKIF